MEFDVNTMKAIGTPEEIVKFLMMVEEPDPSQDVLSTLDDRVNHLPRPPSDRVKSLIDDIVDEEHSWEDDEFEEVYPENIVDFDVVPHVIESGIHKGMFGLRWAGGGYVHNDWSYKSKRKFVEDVYDYHNVPKHRRVYYTNPGFNRN
jgi:hypothetical protein